MQNELPKKQRFIGRVKWFNNKNGYGFLSYENGDIFVHHSALVVPDTQFKFLVEGEYVEFTPVERAGESKESRWTAHDVTGPLRGQLMCQTQTQTQTQTQSERWGKKAVGEEMDSLSKSSKRFRGGGPRSSVENVTVGVTSWKLAGKSSEKFV